MENWTSLCLHRITVTSKCVCLTWSSTKGLCSSFEATSAFTGYFLVHSRAKLIFCHFRFFTLGLLYESQGQHVKAIQVSLNHTERSRAMAKDESGRKVSFLFFFQTWVKIVEDESEDPSDINVFQHIVNTLSNLKHKPIVLKFVDWVLQREQEASILTIIYYLSTAEGRVTQISFSSVPSFAPGMAI